MSKPVLVLLVLAVLVLAAAFVLRGRQGAAPVAATASAPGGMGGAGGPGQPAGGAMGQPAGGGASAQRSLARFGISGMPSQTEPRGLMVTGFLSSPTPSPLQVIGVKEKDVIISCNGESRQMGERLSSALEGLQTRGKKITLVVVRDGKQVTLERTGKLPAGTAVPAPEQRINRRSGSARSSRRPAGGAGRGL